MMSNPTRLIAPVLSAAAAAPGESPLLSNLGEAPLSTPMNALTVAAALLGSPALARICANPLFAATGLLLQVNQEIATGFKMAADSSTRGLLQLAMLGLASWGSSIGAYAFFRGYQSGKTASEIAVKLAVVDVVLNLLEEIRSSENVDLKNLYLDAHLINTSKSVEKTQKHFRGLRDERPKRIEAADQVSRAAQGEPFEKGYRILEQKMEEAWIAAGEAAQKSIDQLELLSTLLASNADFCASLAEGKRLLQSILPGKPPVETYRALKDFSESQAYIRQTVWQATEAERVAIMSPRNWMTEARGEPSLSPFQKRLWETLGNLTERAMLFGVPTVAGLETGAALMMMYRTGQLSGMGLFQSLFGAALLLAPMATVHLYRARQGSRRFNVSPGLNQEYPLERYLDLQLQQKAILRLRKANPPMEPFQRRRYAEKFTENLTSVEKGIAAVESEQLPSPSRSTSSNVVWEKRDHLWGAFSPRRPDPNRHFRYDSHSGDSKERKKLRREIKAMPLDELDRKIMEGGVTHSDIYNMMRSHWAAKNGAAFPRPLTGKLGREIEKMVKEADEKGEVCRFILVKDLFVGPDGAVSAGSKTSWVDGIGESPLIEECRRKRLIPIPCGMTSGANGGVGFLNADGALGHPTMIGYDTAGSSSASVFLLGLDDFPGRLALTTDTGGSTSSPAAVVKLFAWVAEKGTLSRINMIPFATHLDAPGIIGMNRKEVMETVRLLTIPAYSSRLEPAQTAPTVYYFASDIDLVSDGRKKQFFDWKAKAEKVGMEVLEMGAVWSAFRKASLDLYQGAYGTAVFTAMNPLEVNRFGEPVRHVHDTNQRDRHARGLVLLETQHPQHGNLFNWNLNLYMQLKDQFKRKFQTGRIIVAPSPEPVALVGFHPDGTGDDDLDKHDLLGGMLKNITDMALYVDPDDGVTMEGHSTDLLACMGMIEAF
jgi:hypothetical protein